MTGAHLHLALNHVPVVLVPVAVLMLAYAIARHSADLTKGALALLLVSTLFGAGAYFTGESAEEAIEGFPGVSADSIEAHEELAPYAAASTLLAGILALMGFLKLQSGGGTSGMVVATLVVALAAAVLLAWTAYLGGQINHPELRESPPPRVLSSAPPSSEPV